MAKKRGFLFSVMTKIQRISDFQHEFSFSSQQEQFSIFFSRFLQGNLGKIYMAIPWDSLVKSFKLEDSKKGPCSLFSPRGKLALMLLKHYEGCSDRLLIEQLNGNIDYQFFCDLYLGTARLENYKIVSEIRCELAAKLSIAQAQAVFYDHWSAYIKDKDSITMDASCYESQVRLS